LLLKINLRVLGVNKHGDMALHVDTLEMSSSRQRMAFAKQASEELHVKEEIVRHDLSQLWMKLEMLRDEQIAKTLAPKEPVPFDPACTVACRRSPRWRHPIFSVPDAARDRH